MDELRDFYTGRTVLVTGHRGFIGTALCRRLTELGAKVCGIDANADERELVEANGDVKNLYQVRAAFGKADPSVVFHLAAKTEVRASFGDPMLTYRTNVLGALNVLEVCRERKKRVVSLVVASTDKVYGDSGKVSCLENDYLLHNADMYAASKRAADELAQDYTRLYKMPIRILRCANVYGPGQRNETTLITNAITKILRGERPVVHAGARHSVREWLYVDDAVEAYLLAGAHAGNKSVETPVYNVGSRELFSVDAVVGKVLTMFDRSPLDFDLEAESNPQIGDQGLDSGKFRRAFPQWFATSFNEGLKKTVEWYKENYK